MKKQIPMASAVFGMGNEYLILTPDECDGIAVSNCYYPDIQTPVNLNYIKRYKARFGENAPAQTANAATTYHGFNLWAEAVKKAGSVDRMKVIEALETGISFDGPAGKTTIDPSTHHAVLDVYVAEVKNRAYNVIQSYSQQQPSDTAAVCNLKTNPNDNQQYVINVKI
jgi:branched-chain amino acid transport system substrate-binding protein